MPAFKKRHMALWSQPDSPMTSVTHWALLVRTHEHLRAALRASPGTRLQMNCRMPPTSWGCHTLGLCRLTWRKASNHKPQNGWGWKGPLEAIWSAPPPLPELVAQDPHPNGFWILSGISIIVTLSGQPVLVSQPPSQWEIVSWLLARPFCVSVCAHTGPDTMHRLAPSFVHSTL